MISHLAGTVAAIAPEGAVIEVGGVGLLVQCTPGTLATLRPGEPARVATSLAVCSRTKTSRSSSVAKPNRVSASSRTTREVATRAGSPGRSVASVPGVH